jgi:hypothetical protein
MQIPDYHFTIGLVLGLRRFWIFFDFVDDNVQLVILIELCVLRTFSQYCLSLRFVVRGWLAYIVGFGSISTLISCFCVNVELNLSSVE